MNKTMKKIYVKPQTVSVCTEMEQMLLAASVGTSTTNVQVSDWDDSTSDGGSTNLGSETIDFDGLW